MDVGSLYCAPSLESLDPKLSMLFFHDAFTPSPSLECSLALPHRLNKHSAPQIWEISDFLSAEECDALIDRVQASVRPLGRYAPRDRLLAFDVNDRLLDLLQTRLHHSDSLTQRLASHGMVEPYGFAPPTKWHPHMSLNPCLRFTRFRDAQFTTSSQYCRSTFTLLVYLNDSSSETEFLLSDPVTSSGQADLVYCGLTVDEELAHLGTSGRRIHIRPEKGKAVLFDQRLLHKSTPLSDDSPKWVLRADVLLMGSPIETTDGKSTQSASPVFLETQRLCRELFRQAQYLELNDLSVEANALYERCLNLRQAPHLLTAVPVHLRVHLTPLSVARPVPFTSLAFVSRNGRSCTFEASQGLSEVDVWPLIYLSALYMLYQETQSLELEPEEVSDDKKQSGQRQRVVQRDLERVRQKRNQALQRERDQALQRERQRALQGERKRAWANMCAQLSDALELKLGDGPPPLKLRRIESVQKRIAELTEEHGRLTEDTMEAQVEFVEELAESFMEPTWNERDWTASPKPCPAGVTVDLALVKTTFRETLEGSYCGLCDPDDWIDPEEMDILSKSELSVNVGAFVLCATGIQRTYPNGLSGRLSVQAPAVVFNHASCQCEKVWVEKDTVELKHRVWFTFDFSVQGSRITLVAEPHVTV